ncbi:MAG: hypothetical protein Q9174_006464 [Haloplaca sp. 1 TL-2023]
MKYFVALVAAAVAVSAQDPPGCDSNRAGTFVLNPVNISSGEIPDLSIEDGRTICGSTPVVRIEDGVLTDQCGRTGSVVANSQFQFDNPVQVDALATSGFSICENNTLAVLGSAIFYQCLNAETEQRSAFNNLYSENQGGQCNQSYIQAVFCEVSDEQEATFEADATCLYSDSPSTGVQSSTAAPPTTTGGAEDSGDDSDAATTTAAAAPFPTNNGTAPAPSGSAPAPGPTGAPGEDVAPFEGSAATLVLGGKVVALIAGFAAFAML